MAKDRVHIEIFNGKVIVTQDRYIFLKIEKGSPSLAMIDHPVQFFNRFILMCISLGYVIKLR